MFEVRCSANYLIELLLLLWIMIQIVKSIIPNCPGYFQTHSNDDEDKPISINLIIAKQLS